MVRVIGSRFNSNLEAAGRSVPYQYHSEAAEAGIADLAQVRQKRVETVSKYVQRFREVKNRCYSSRITEKEAVDFAVLGLAKPIKDLAF